MKEYGDIHVEFNDSKLTIKIDGKDIGFVLSSDFVEIFKQSLLLIGRGSFHSSLPFVSKTIPLTYGILTFTRHR